MIAARRGNVAVSRVLLAHNANGARRDEAGHDAMYFAEASGNQEVIDLVRQATTGVRTRLYTGQGRGVG
jgi:ankyrin repeat protein